jgi:hydrogenase expression/formation protein HypC
MFNASAVPLVQGRGMQNIFRLQGVPSRKAYSIYTITHSNRVLSVLTAERTFLCTEARMCVGLAAKVVKVSDGMAVIDATGAQRTVSAELLSDLEPGDYVMVHAGMAIAKITSDDKKETDAIMGDLN